MHANLLICAYENYIRSVFFTFFFHCAHAKIIREKAMTWVGLRKLSTSYECSNTAVWKVNRMHRTLLICAIVVIHYQTWMDRSAAIFVYACPDAIVPSKLVIETIKDRMHYVSNH